MQHADPEWAKINLQYPLWPRLRCAQAQRCSPHPQLRALSSSHPNSSSERQDAGASLCKWFLWVATRNSHCRPAERYARSPTQEASQGKHSSCDRGDKAHQPRQQMRELEQCFRSPIPMRFTPSSCQTQGLQPATSASPPPKQHPDHHEPLRQGALIEIINI